MFGRPWTEFGAGPRLAGAGRRCALGAGFAALFAGGAPCGAGGAFLLSWAKAKDETTNKTRMTDGFPRAFLLRLFDFMAPPRYTNLFLFNYTTRT